MSGADHERLGWDEFGVGARELAAQIGASGYDANVMLAIARGGLPVVGAVSYALGVKNCATINVEYYTGIDERLDVPVILPPLLDVADLSDARLLVVDDVADTGETLRPSVADQRTAVLNEKSRSVVRCDYVWRRTERWIEFPWSDPPAGA